MMSNPPSLSSKVWLLIVQIVSTERQRITRFGTVLVLLLLISSLITHAQSCWLETSGTQVVNAQTGQPVTLRAVGLGNWVLQEGYMLHPQGCEGCPGTQWQMKKRLYDEGQTYEQVEKFYQQWRDTFITKADIDYIASLGFNSVRLPMHYELFLAAEQRKVRNGVINDLNYGHDRYKDSLRRWHDNDQLFNDPTLEGFRVIDQLLGWCKENGMYVVLDLHAAPGGQGSDANIADIFHDNNLWLFPVFQDVTNRLWERISQRYKAEPTIAFYDLINEPNNVPGGGPAIHALTQRLITTIRNQGDNHILVVEGNGWGNNYDYLEPFTLSPNWGLVYSAHRYWIDPSDDRVPDSNPNGNQINRMVDLVNFRDTHQVPVWVGETGENDAAWLRQNIAKLEAEGIGWCHWTYKRHDVFENAALMRIGGNYPTDGATAMATVLESIKFENCIPNPTTIAAVTQDNPAPGTSGCAAGETPAIPLRQTIWLRGFNEQYVSSGNGIEPMRCDRPSVEGWEVFTVVDAGFGKIALQGSNDRYVSSEDGKAPIRCDQERIGAGESFEWVATEDGKVGFKGNNDRFISCQNGVGPMTCDSPELSDWEAFTWRIISVSEPIVTSVARTAPASDHTYRIYPNPTSGGTFRVEVGQPSRVVVSDLSGRVVRTTVVFHSSDIKDMASGLYLVDISNAQQHVVKKIVVED